LSLRTPMWCTFLRIIRGWFTDIPWWRGRDGIRIRESGLAGLISRSESALGSDGGAASDGAGDIGDSTGITTMRGLTAGGTTPAAGRFITGELLRVADLHGAVVLTGAVEEPEHSMETGRRPGDMPRRAVRAASARGPLAATTTEDRPGVFRRVATPASAAGFMAAGGTEAGGGNRRRVGFPVVGRF